MFHIHCLSLLSCVEREGGRERAALAFVSDEVPEPGKPLAVDLDGKLELVGVDAPERVRPGDAIEVTWYWRCRAPVGPGWKLFTHVEARGAVRENADHEGPVREGLPPSRWRPGQYVRDLQTIEIPSEATGPVTIYVGIWKGDERLRVRRGPSDGHDRVRALVLPLDAGGAGRPPSEPALPELRVPRARGALRVDGRLDEAAWRDAARTGPFIGSDGHSSRVPRTTARLLWDGAALWVGWDCVDPRIESRYRDRDDALWNADVVEVFLDPRGHASPYYELQVSPAGVIFDSRLPRYRQNQNDWSSGMEAAAKVDGTLNEGDDDDRGWTAEMRIPLGGLEGGPPRAGSRWRANLFRLDLVPGSQSARGAAWSPPIRPDFHRTERFGWLVFE